MTPARLTASTEPSLLQSGIQIVSTVIGPDLHGGSSDGPTRPARCEWIAALCLTAAVALLLVVAGHAAGRRAYDVAPLLFWSGVVLLVVPLSLRIGWSGVARGERLFLLLLLTEALFYYKSVYSPTSFVGHDEFLHWVATDNLLATRRLFLSNPLLPIGPAYPALEILATAIVNLTGLTLFAAATLLLAVLKGTVVCGLFLFYEKLCGRPRIAAIAALVNMGCSTFVLFESTFSYESLGIALCVVTFAVEAASRDLDGRPRLQALGLIALLLASLAVTHHLSAAFAAVYFGTLAGFEALRRGPLRIEARLAMGFTAILAIALPLVWIEAHGNPLTGYLGPVVEAGFETLLGKIMGAPSPKSEHLSVPAQPLAVRLTTLMAILLLAIGLATGFFRTLAMTAPSVGRTGWRPIQDILRRRWRDSRIVVLTMFAFGFPVSVAFRLTIGGWEIGNRMGTFAFIAAGLLVAVSVVHFWEGHARQRIAAALALVIIVSGGVTASSLYPIHGGYRVAADGQSVEPMGIEAAQWTKAWLGTGNRFTSDRVNRLLLASYGRQDVRLKVVEGVAPARVFENETLGPDEFWALVRSDIDFLLVDLRLSTAPPVLGFYFEQWEARHGKKLSGAELLKFDDVKGVTRIFDNGWIVIYDVRGLHGNS